MECDFWSIGVVTYILLCGMPPFYSEDNIQMFDNIKNCKYTFDEKVWKEVSDEAKNFISDIFVEDPKKRINLENMMEHEWMKADLEPENKLTVNKQALGEFVLDGIVDAEQEAA